MGVFVRGGGGSEQIERDTGSETSSELVTPVTTSDWDNRELSKDDGTTDALGALDTKTDVTIFITKSDDGLESGTLTDPDTFLGWLQDFVLQLWSNEMIDNFEFLDWESKCVDSRPDYKNGWGGDGDLN